MGPESRKWRACACAAVVVSSALALVAASAAAAPAGPDQGVTDSSVKIGFISSKTGVAASTSGSSDVGCKARIGRENAAGGVHGRKIDVEYVDDKSSNANLTQAESLVQNDHVFMVINDSAFAFLTYRWLLDHEVPQIGGGFDGNYYGEAGNEKVISAFGNGPPIAGIQTTLTPKIMKALGAKKIAAIGYGVSPSSSANVKGLQQYAVPALGLDPVYTNTSVDFGTSDVGPLVLGMKNAGADGGYYAMDLSTNLALAQGLTQNGVRMKAQIMATGYGHELLDQPVSKTLGPDIVLMTGWAPVELKTKATKRFQTDLEKYAGFTGVPDFGIYTGYIDCDLAILGLQKQGKDLDQSTYADDLRSLGSFNPGGGLGCSTVGLGLDTYGKISPGGTYPGQRICTWALQVEDGKFVVLEPEDATTTYWTGKLIEQSVDPQYLVTTTTGGTATR
jgi:branched-chain amino acid transport system substrate-binding protein